MPAEFTVSPSLSILAETVPSFFLSPAPTMAETRA
ncbi:hypothetical protein S101446_01600 [Komagataeibacter europaeus]|nr:hypothetical protein S101446_01600 [Komagataeibacter europaeus]